MQTHIAEATVPVKSGSVEKLIQPVAEPIPDPILTGPQLRMAEPKMARLHTEPELFEPIPNSKAAPIKHAYTAPVLRATTSDEWTIVRPRYPVGVLSQPQLTPHDVVPAAPQKPQIAKAHHVPSNRPIPPQTHIVSSSSMPIIDVASPASLGAEPRILATAKPAFSPPLDLDVVQVVATAPITPLEEPHITLPEPIAGTQIIEDEPQSTAPQEPIKKQSIIRPLPRPKDLTRRKASKQTTQDPDQAKSKSKSAPKSNVKANVFILGVFQTKARKWALLELGRDQIVTVGPGAAHENFSVQRIEKGTIWIKTKGTVLKLRSGDSFKAG
ncbi:MAG: hypothetical protein ACPGVK_03590 [Halocynthiibacter sp.]